MSIYRTVLLLLNFECLCRILHQRKPQETPVFCDLQDVDVRNIKSGDVQPILPRVVVTVVRSLHLTSGVDPLLCTARRSTSRGVYCSNYAPLEGASENSMIIIRQSIIAIYYTLLYANTPIDNICLACGGGRLCFREKN